jgi:glycosyltransferase involved in cell wall biosynthesis
VKLLQVVSSYLPAVRYGGTIVSVHGLCRALAARGHEVHVFTTSVDGANDSAVAHGEPVDVDGVKVWYFGSERLRRIYYAPGMSAALAAHVREFDVVHTHAIYLWPLWAAARAARRAGVPYVVSPRGMLERELVSRKSPLLKAVWLAGIERHNLAGAAAIHVTSRREADEAAAFGLPLPAVHQIPNGVDLEPAGGPVSAAVRALIAGGPYVLFLGRINWKKGLDRLLRALASVPGARLVIAGNDEEQHRDVLQQLADRLGVAARIAYTGPVRAGDKAALLADAELLVLPSYSENFGNVVIEAMAAGRPVVVTREVGVADVVADAHAGLVVDGDSGELATALTSLLSQPALREEMGARGRAAARERFAWPAVATRMEAMYESLLTRRDGRQ